MRDPGLDPLTEAEMLRLLGGIHSRTLRRMVADGEFPPGFRAGRGLGLRWYRRDVDAYLWLRMRLADAPRPAKRRRGLAGGEGAG